MKFGVGVGTPQLRNAAGGVGGDWHRRKAVEGVEQRVRGLRGVQVGSGRRGAAWCSVLGKGAAFACLCISVGHCSGAVKYSFRRNTELTKIFL